MTEPTSNERLNISFVGQEKLLGKYKRSQIQLIPGVSFAEKPGTGFDVANDSAKSQRCESATANPAKGLLATTGLAYNGGNDAGLTLTSQLADNLVEVASRSSDLKSSASTRWTYVLLSLLVVVGLAISPFFSDWSSTTARLHSRLRSYRALCKRGDLDYLLQAHRLTASQSGCSCP